MRWFSATLEAEGSRPGVSMKRRRMPLTTPSTTCTCTTTAHKTDCQAHFGILGRHLLRSALVLLTTGSAA